VAHPFRVGWGGVLKGEGEEGEGGGGGGAEDFERSPTH